MRIRLVFALIFLCGTAMGADDLKLFLSDGPTKDYPDKMMLFGQLVGDWDIDYHAYLQDGSNITAKCEWHWRWGLDGRAVVDSVICPPRVERLKPEALKTAWGIKGRQYDPTNDACPTLFVG